MPTSFLHYKMLRKLGEGGMGIVYLAHDTKLNRDVAIKFLPIRVSRVPSEQQRFRQEAQAAAVLNHPNIAHVYAIEEVEGELFIVMEYVEGAELKSLIDNGSLNALQKKVITKEIALGINAAHQRGIIHRDIKTRNIMIDSQKRTKIMDFGLARVQDTGHITQMGTTLGTTAYMAPEMLSGQEADIQSDIWAFGVVLYELFTGQLPFRGVYEQAVMYAIAEQKPDPVSQITPGVPKNIERVINRCLIKDKSERYQNFEEIISDLTDDNSAGDRISAVSKISSRVARSKYTYVGGPAVLIILGVIFFMSYRFSLFRSSVPDKKYLAVLPIENIGDNPDLKPICAGLAERFSYKLSELGTNKDSYWVAPASEMRKEQITSASKAKRMFGVNLAIASSIQIAGDSTRLILELIDADKIRRLETAQVVVPSRNLALLEQNGVKAVLNMLHIEMNSKMNKTLENGQPSDPGAYTYYLSGRSSIQSYGNSDSLESAIHLFEKSVEIDPEFALGYAGLGESYWHKYQITGDVPFLEEAEKAVARAIKLNKHLAPVQTLFGIIKAGTGAYGQATVHFTKAMEIDSKYSFAYSELAKVYDEEGETAKAEQIYKQAIMLKPDYWGGYKDLGIHYLNKGKFDAAINEFQKALKITPQNSIPYSNIGVAYYYKGNIDKAREFFEKSMALNKSSSTASNLAGIYYSEGEYKAAANMYEIALKDNANRYEFWGNLAAAYDLSDQPEKARQAYQTAIEKAGKKLSVNPKDSQVLGDLAAYYSDVSDTLSALHFLKRALAINPNNLWIRSRAVSTYEKIGMRNEALKWVDSTMLSDIESQPELKSLVADPRYKKLKNKITSSVHQ